MSTMTAQTTQVYQVFIKATPEQVWDAITNPDFTAKYFYGTRFESTLQPGASFLFRSSDGDAAMVEGTIDEVSPPHRLSHSWRPLFDDEMSAEEPSRVTWEIEPADGGVTKLTVVHDRLEAAPKTAESVAGGWSLILSGLKTLLETGEPLAS
jgi:uncharacterized protein YndB with AHSA1/START domain